MWRWSVVLVALGGCDYVFHLTHVGPGQDMHDAQDGQGTADAMRPRPDGEPTGCPADYNRRFEATASLYKLVLSHATWSGAEQDCANDSLGLTHLIVLSNRDEWLTLITVPATYLTDDTWIGVTAQKLGNNQYQWVTAENTNGFVVPAVVGAEPWEGDQPDGGNECGELRALSGALHDAACSSSSNYICECDAHPEVPTNI